MAASLSQSLGVHTRLLTESQEHKKINSSESVATAQTAETTPKLTAVLNLSPAETNQKTTATTSTPDIHNQASAVDESLATRASAVPDYPPAIVPPHATASTTVLRHNRVSDEWIVFFGSLWSASSKQPKKPRDYSAPRTRPRAHERPKYEEKCPFCVGHEMQCCRLLAAAIDTHTGQWHCRCFANRFAVFHALGSAKILPEHQFTASGEDSVRVRGAGCMEVIVASRRHDMHAFAHQPPSVVRALVSLWVQRAAYMATRVDNRHIMEPGEARDCSDQKHLQRDRSIVEHVAMFCSHGGRGGGSLSHAHLQLVGLQFVPPEVLRLVQVQRTAAATHGTCVVCQTVQHGLAAHAKATEQDETEEQKSTSATQNLGLAGDDQDSVRKRRKTGSPPAPTLPNDSCVVFSNENMVAMAVTAVQRGTVWVFPRQCVRNITLLTPAAVRDLADALRFVATAMYIDMDDPDMNVAVWSAPINLPVQIPFHFYVTLVPHVFEDASLGRLQYGVALNSRAPEETAFLLRKAMNNHPASQETVGNALRLVHHDRVV